MLIPYPLTPPVGWRDSPRTFDDGLVMAGRLIRSTPAGTMDAFEVLTTCYNAEYANGLRAGLSSDSGLELLITFGQAHTMLIGVARPLPSTNFSLAEALMLERQRLERLSVPTNTQTQAPLLDCLEPPSPALESSDTHLLAAE
ncbi:MAG: hypothetical protein WAZ18_01985 [Alphaproteobacteria bacterium]